MSVTYSLYWSFALVATIVIHAMVVHDITIRRGITTVDAVLSVQHPSRHYYPSSRRVSVEALLSVVGCIALLAHTRSFTHILTFTYLIVNYGRRKSLMCGMQ